MSQITKAFRFNRVTLLGAAILLGFPISTPQALTQSGAHDPGVRGGPPGAGSFVAGLTQNQQSYFASGLADFADVESVKGGLGPRFNAESCAQCHAQPAIGGSSPLVNPLVAAATDQGGTNQIPSFITIDGPVREARFPLTSDLRQRDGGVHALFTITGRGDATGCSLKQPDFQGAASANKLVFRIPTPVFGGGLIESIPNAAILAQVNSQAEAKRSMGIGGRPNRVTTSNIAGSPNTSGNDGTVTRFGWKAQNKSLEIFSGEAYNVEMGVTNELFPNEREEATGCRFNATPEETCTRTSCCITWGPGWRTRSSRDRRRQTSFGPRHCEGSDSAPTFSTMAAPRTWSGQFCTTQATEDGDIRTRRPIRLSTNSAGSRMGTSRTC